MKKTVITFLFIFLYCMSIQAQHSRNEQSEPVYFPTGTSWREALTNSMDESYCGIDHYVVGNDTIINGISYKKLYLNDALSFCALREFEGKLFLYLYDLKKERLAYDFVWEIGKKLYFQMAEAEDDYHQYCTITDIKQIQLSDSLYYDYIDYGSDCKIIKDIGSEEGLFTIMFEQPTNGDQISLLCFSRGDVLIYKNPRFVDCESCWRGGPKPIYFETGTMWIEATTNQFDKYYCKLDYYEIGNDTIINNVLYKKVYQNDALSSYALRESDDKMFLYFYDLKQERLVYDFAWEPGKKLYYQNVETGDDYLLLCTITDIKKIKLDYYYFDYVDYNSDCKIIKGVGSEGGIFTHVFPQLTNGDEKSLLCFSRGCASYMNPRFVDCESCQRSGSGIETNKINTPFRYVNDTFYFFFKDSGDIMISLYDTKATKVFSKLINGKDFLSLNFLANGIYFYRIAMNDGTTYTGNLVVNN